MNRRKLVKNFYTFSSSEENAIAEFLDPEVILFWNGSTGFRKLKIDDIIDLAKQMNRGYASLRADISHLLREKNSVTIRFTYYVKTIENPEEELPLAHFMAIWEIKEGKLFKGYQISQLADDNQQNLSSFLVENI